MNTDKLAINWQNFTRVRLQRKFAFILNKEPAARNRHQFSQNSFGLDSLNHRLLCTYHFIIFHILYCQTNFIFKIMFLLTGKYICKFTLWNKASLHFLSASPVVYLLFAFPISLPWIDRDHRNPAISKLTNWWS